jgi:YegS/Rv2252/BmrU family lipid kinase
MDEVNKVLFIINKFAGTGYQPELEGRILARSEAHDVETKIMFTEGPGHATALALDAKKHGFGRVVAVGGDGTLNEVAQGLFQSQIPMGIIARGSGNGLARHLGIPLAIPAAIENVFTGSPLAMDTFTLNGKVSLNVSGIGFDGHIANLFGGKTKRGITGYASLILQEYLRFREFEFDMAIGAEPLVRKAFVVAIANSSQYGNNACIAPAASVTDGILHVNVLRKVPPYRFDFVYNFFNRTIHRSRFSEMFETPSLKIRTRVPVPYHVDGEPCGIQDQFNIQISPGALPVIVPDVARLQ